MNQMIPLKRAAQIIAGQSPPSNVVSEFDESQLPFLQGNAEFGPLHPDARLQCDAAPKKAERGDVLLSVRAPVGALNIANRSYGIGRGLCAIRPRAELDETFAWWVVTGMAPRLAAVATGSTYDAVTVDDVGILPIPLPPLATQRAIADYLNRETARIDALIAAKCRMVELLEERDITLMHELTSRGLHKSTTVDTDVYWLGPIPAHWQAMKIRRVGYVRRGASPRPIDDPIYFDDDGEYAWVRIADVTDSERYLTKTTQRLSQLGSSLSARLSPGSLFISIAGSVGKPMITKIECCVHDGFVYFERLRVCPDYLYYLFKASQLFQGLGKLGTQLNLNTETIGDIVIPIPPLDEQYEIVVELDRRLGLSNELRLINLCHIELLRERRQALITAAVTGQLDIPEAA